MRSDSSIPVREDVDRAEAALERLCADYERYDGLPPGPFGGPKDQAMADVLSAVAALVRARRAQ